MPRLEKQHVVKHSARDMYDLVCDVNHYPEFVPLCQSLSIKDKRERGAKTLIMADMTMAYKMLSETFTTQVLMNSELLEIDVKYIDGPFKHLENTWKFEELTSSECRVHFMIDYELRSKMLAMAAGTVFDMAFGRFVDAFEARADQIYPKTV
ncbi:MAG: SRPBCC family protein [Rhizobiaceae bacterium]|nr:SRPBCC family protein [Rhizobiaceae bacterium]